MKKFKPGDTAYYIGDIYDKHINEPVDILEADLFDDFGDRIKNTYKVEFKKGGWAFIGESDLCNSDKRLEIELDKLL